MFLYLFLVRNLSCQFGGLKNAHHHKLVDGSFPGMLFATFSKKLFMAKLCILMIKT